MPRRSIVVSMLLVLMMSVGLLSCAGQGSSSKTTQISVWTYYNGDQLSAFHQLVGEFNSTVGKEKGIVVESYNLGSVSDLQEAVIASIDGKVGAQPTPNIFAAYADTAYEIDQRGLLVDLNSYINEEVRAQYVDGYFEEGALGAQDSVKIFPIAKSVEVFCVNATDFDSFAEATAVDYDDLSTFEGLCEVAQKYYEWTDAQTDEANDGKAFFGIDALANYFFIGAQQLGASIVEVNDGQATLTLDKQTARKLWDNYYLPFVKGYFDASARYRSDDVKTERIISLLGSTSGATYFPRQVVDSNGFERDVEMRVLPAPQFKGGEAYAVQQGAGMVVFDSNTEEIEASIAFLEWFTEPEQNIQFSVLSGYLPVMKSANDMDTIRSSFDEPLDERMDQILEVGLETVANNSLFTPKAFANGTEFRNVLEQSLFEKASTDAAAVKEALADGKSYEEAIAPYVSQDCFEAWYKEFYAQLEALVG